MASTVVLQREIGAAAAVRQPALSFRDQPGIGETNPGGTSAQD